MTTVLIIDDNPDNLRLLSDTLDEAGYRVLIATDGARSVSQCERAQPDIILLDVLMPGLDGFETCRRLKQTASLGRIPIIFMTGRGELDDRLRGFEEGAVDYIVKPIMVEEVLARIAAHLQNAQQIKRSEEVLAKGAIAATTVTRSGRLTWLTPTATHWLNALEEGEYPIGALAPEPLIQWLHRLDARATQTAFSLRRGRQTFTAQPTRFSPAADEILLFLESENTEWDFEKLKSSFGLTNREVEVLMWIARGKTNRDIAKILDNSPRTVNKHLEHVFEKLGVPTRAAAIAMVLNTKG